MAANRGIRDGKENHLLTAADDQVRRLWFPVSSVHAGDCNFWILLLSEFRCCVLFLVKKIKIKIVKKKIDIPFESCVPLDQSEASTCATCFL
jgi:hypothetical protein